MHISIIFFFFIHDSSLYIFFLNIFKNFQMKAPVQISISSEKFEILDCRNIGRWCFPV